MRNGSSSSSLSSSSFITTTSNNKNIANTATRRSNRGGTTALVGVASATVTSTTTTGVPCNKGHDANPFPKRELIVYNYHHHNNNNNNNNNGTKKASSSSSSTTTKKMTGLGLNLMMLAIIVLIVEMMQVQMAVKIAKDTTTSIKKHDDDIQFHNRTMLTFKKSDRIKATGGIMGMAMGRPLYQDLRNHTKVAYVVTVTECPPGDDNAILQGAAILSQNIKLMSADSAGHHTTTTSSNTAARYVHHLYAFVHPDAKRCGMIMAAYGWKILWKTIPFQMPDLNGNTRDLMKLRKHVGCCGVDEYIKLHIYSMTNYPIVVHLDLDTVLLRPLDKLFDWMLKHPGSKRDLPTIATLQRGGENGSLADRPETIDFFFTRDYALNGTLTRDHTKRSIQGAFLIVRPNQTLLDDMIRVLTKTEFTKERGWDNKLYGTGDHGAIAVPGFLSYYYGEHYPSHRIVELDPCRYNTYAYDFRYHDDDGDDENSDAAGKNHTSAVSSQQRPCRTGQAAGRCEDCSKTPLQEIVSGHFATHCHAPWKCPKYVGSSSERPLCQRLHQAWHRVRAQFDVIWDQSPPPRGGWGRNNTLGYCRGTGRRSFMHVPIPHALQGMT